MRLAAAGLDCKHLIRPLQGVFVQNNLQECNEMGALARSASCIESVEIAVMLILLVKDL